MIARPNAALSQIHTQIMWSRLVAVVEEQAQTLVRTAFSTPVREAGDLSAGVFDARGRMLAQAVTGTPGHVNSMANAVRHFLDVYPLETMRPGDHYITNDPWLTCGHLHDLTVVSPTFLDGRPVGLFACTVHVVTLGDTIYDASREAMLEAIRALPKGTYRNRLVMDGYDKPLTLQAAMTVSDDGIHVDYAGTSPASTYGINVVLNYTLAYTAFGVKCLVAPEVPNNAGSLSTVTVSAPEGCVLNVKRPFPVAARHTVGHMLPDLVFGCLEQVLPERVPAEGASALWNPQINGGGSAVDQLPEGVEPGDPKSWSTVIFHCGGAGARPAKDGLSVTAFPSGVRTIPVEATETMAPILFRRREFREGSGGAGEYRGGVGAG